jgi:hypothetical protein
MENVTLKVSELSGVALDWAVAKCEGFTVEYEEDRNDFWVTRTNHAQQFLPPFDYLSKVFHPSTDWAQGGPIIERESISILCTDDYEWVAGYGTTQWDRGCPTSPTPLIAAMRCYVASKLGDKITVPLPLIG